MVDCVSLTLGGTVGASSITGGTNIGGLRFGVFDWSGLWGTVAVRGSTAAIAGRAGRTLVGSRLPNERLLTLNLISLDQLEAGGYTTTRCAQIDTNQQTLTGLFGDPDGLVIEWLRQNGTSVYLVGYTLTGAPLVATGRYRRLSQPLVATWPYWRSTIQQTDTTSGAGTITVGGTAPVYDPVLVFSGNGSFTNSDTGQVVTIAGLGAGAVTVDCGARTVTQAGLDVDGALSVSDSEWVRLDPGTVNVTSTVSVDVKWRDQWK
jgi:hypothetical protein